MVFTFAVSVMAADYSDTENHWANAQIEKWSDEGILQGSDGKFRPSDSITRGEMAIILDRIMDYQVKAKNSFGDLASEAYFTDAILKANASGVILGDAGKVRPKDYITREEAAVMLGRAFGLTASANASSNFTDKANVASWASAMVLTMEQKGFIGGTDGKFLPKNNISRAEVVKIVDNIIKGFVTKAGTYTANVEGTLVVNAPNVILKGITIGGDLVVAPGVGEGEITLDNVTVKGNLVVKGGGVNSIVIKGNSDIGKVLVTKVGNQVRVVTEGNADVEIVVVDDGSDDVVLTGSFGDVQVNASDVVVKAVDASITNAKIEGTKSKVVLDAKSTVNTLTLSAAGAEVSGDKGAVVKSVVAESTAKGAEITGNITVEKAEVKANNVAVNTVGTKVTVSAGVTGTTSNGNTVNAGTTVTTTTTAPSTSTGSGGGGGSSTVAVSAISVVVDGEGEATISAKDGTLQLKANVTPSTASNKSVTWSVDEPEIATISNTGLLTAKTNGKVTVTATAKDGSGEKGSLVVTVSEQEKTLSVATIGSLRIPATEEIFAWANGYNHSVWNGLNVTGTLYNAKEKSVPAFGKDSGEKWFLPFAITAPADVADGATVKITGLKAGKESSFTYTKDHFETDKKVLQVLWAVEKDENITIVVDWDGEGANYTAKEYTLNLKGLTLSENETPPLKVVSIEKNSEHVKDANNTTVNAVGNVVTIGGKIPYQAESILGHAEGSYLYEFKVTLDNLGKEAACKTEGSTTNIYAASDNWLDGDNYFKFVGDASNRQNITITIDNDGNWKTTEDQLVITVKVAADAQLGEDSTATITLDGEDAHSNTKYNGENHDLKLSNDLKVTGALKYHETDPTDMGFAAYDKHFMVFTIKDLPETGATITVEGKANGSDSSTTYTLTGNSEVFVWGVEANENIEITVNYGEGFEPMVYTLDLSGVTLEDPNAVIGTHTVEVGDTAVPGFERNTGGTITVDVSAVADGKITGEALSALNAQVPGTDGNPEIGYTGFDITFNAEEGQQAKGIEVYADDKKLNATLDGENLIKLYAAIADRTGDEGSYTWKVREEKVEWKLVWLDAENNVIGRTFFTTDVKMGSN
jgi:hypothetical protein